MHTHTLRRDDDVFLEGGLTGGIVVMEVWLDAGLTLPSIRPSSSLSSNEDDRLCVSLGATLFTDAALGMSAALPDDGLVTVSEEGPFFL